MKPKNIKNYREVVFEGEIYLVLNSAYARLQREGIGEVMTRTTPRVVYRRDASEEYVEIRNASFLGELAEEIRASGEELLNRPGEVWINSKTHDREMNDLQEIAYRRLEDSH